MATIHRGSPSRYVLPPSSAHYVPSPLDATTPLQMRLRAYNAYMMDGQLVQTAPLPTTPPPPLDPAEVSLSMSLSSLSLPKPPQYAGGISPSPLFLNPLVPKPFPPPQPVELLHVSPGVPTPIELSVYDNKQPTGVLHVTIGNQTVEFLDGVANLPQKR